MRITAVETIHLRRGITVNWGPIQWLWVRIHTDSGLVGLGETCPHPEAEKAVVLRSLAPVLLGRDPSQIDRLWADMLHAVAYCGWAGAEMRAVSAVDIALWDLAGKVANQPVYQLLGGASRESIRTYNTCYDHIDFLTEPVRLAEELAKSGIHAMKIWPFDPVAKETGGQYITADQMRRGIEPLRLIRQAFGDSMDVAMEFHAYWNLPCAIHIAQAVEPYAPMWLEEMLPHDNLAAYRQLAETTRLPLCLSERLMTRFGFRELMQNQAARIIMPDICWCGGISEAKKIATMAETHYLPVAPHNCGGPLLHVASLHLAANVTNLYILESVRRHYLDEYRGIVTETCPPVDGEFGLPPGPGLGVELCPEVMKREDVQIDRA
ncbi:MAG TPA: mandelate racemase/muconate lactonizing enzyme family protein [Bryobacteraceae bacterium]|jgi:L-alanine-DL-glutamate epimerase-like enolase superfamily enzyme|nr:mandelate racemase/muconate lactonizing enzyme family protein [Bryobacteraceae bacterium]